MKKFFYALLAICIFASTLLFASCGETQSEQGTQGSQNNENNKNNNSDTALVAIEDLSEFTVVRGENASADEKTVAVKLRKTLNSDFGAGVKIATDYDAETKKEILVGHTSREATKAAEELKLTNSEYLIKRTGDKIVILGGSDEALAAAVDYWTTEMVNESGQLCVSGGENGYRYSPDTKKFDSLTIDGNSIYDYVVVNSSAMLAPVADAIIDTVCKNADITLSLLEEEGNAEHIIKICTPDEDAQKSSVEVKDGNLYITPSYYDIYWASEYLKSVLDGASAGDFDITSAINAEDRYEIHTFYDKDDVMAVFKKVYNSDDIIVGTEVNNGGNIVTEVLDYYYAESGEYPGMIGLDLRLANLHEMGPDGVGKTVADLTRFAENGGIVTVCAHFSNPAENGGDPTIQTFRGKLGGDDKWAELITEGTEYNTSFMIELDAIADVFEALRDNGVPVIWRPFHEANGNWFWFCMVQPEIKTKISEESFINLWKYVYNYFTEVRGLDNLLWEFGPNIGSESETMVAPLYGFPGKEYVDMVGFDWYTSDMDTSRLETTPTYSDLASLGMPVSICEFGPAGDIKADTDAGQPALFSCRNLMGMLEEMRRLDGEYRFAYLLTWVGRSSIPSLGYSDEFMANEKILGQADVKAMLEALQ